MNNEVILNLNSIDKAKKFSMLAYTFDSDIDISSGRYLINAKSIMGIFSLDLSRPVVVKIESYDEEEITRFNEVMEEFK